MALEVAELGIEATRKIKVRDFPAFVIDDKGNDVFDLVNNPCAGTR
jgi:tartrate dehydratase beta subunit/fumarate hydratase class I family protein